jgi:hypothetical protein
MLDSGFRLLVTDAGSFQVHVSEQIHYV